MKVSKFVHWCEGKDDALLLLNTYTNELYSFKGKYKNEILSVLEKNHGEISQECVDFLEKEKILVDENVDESLRAELKYFHTAHSSEKLLLTILPTEDCNFRCQYCYEPHNKGKMSSDIIEAIKRYIDKNLCYYKSLQVNWFGGEPLEAFDVVEELSKYFIKKCAEQKKVYRASMTTNGYNLSLELFKKLHSYHVLDYQITLDGVAKTHNKSRFLKDGSGTFDIILGNLKRIRDNIDNSTFHIVIRTNITKTVMDDIDTYINLINKEFGEDRRFGVIFKMAWSNNQDTEFNRIELLPTGNLKGVLEKCLNTKLNFSLNRTQICSASGICYAASSNAYVIGADGKIYKCTVEFDKEINQIGKLSVDGKLKIDYDKLAFWTMRGTSDIYEKCKGCYFQPACMGIYCPINRFDNKGKHQCSGMKDYVDMYMKLCQNTSGLVKEIENYGNM